MAKVVMSVKEYLTLQEAVEGAARVVRAPNGHEDMAAQRAAQSLEIEIARLRVENEKLRAAPPAPASMDVRAAYTTIEHVFKVLQFAVANLPPETVPGWPYEALREFALSAKSVLTYADLLDQTTREMLDEFLSFAREAEAHEKRRGPRVPATVRGTPGIETEEARAAHEQLVVIPGKLPGNVT